MSTESIAQKTNDKFAWPVTIVVWLAGMCAPANMAKVTTLAPVLMEAFNISESGIGWVIAVFYVLGVIIAIPAGNICVKIGLKPAILASLACGIVGGLVGIFSPDLTVFMVSRVLEGASMGIMAVAGAAAISPWFPNSKKGTPLGIWALWVSVSTIINPIVYAWLQEATGTWVSSWWMMIVLGVICFILVGILYKEPNYTFDDNENMIPVDSIPAEELPKGSVKAAFKVPAFWAVMIIVVIDGIGFMAMNGFITTYLTAQGGVDLGQAATLVSLGAIVGAVATVGAGWLSDKIGSCKMILLFGLVLAVVFMWLVFSCEGFTTYIPIEIICGLYCGTVGAMTWGLVGGKLLPDEAIAGGTAGMALFQNLGFFLGAMCFGILLEMLGGFGQTMHMVIVPSYVVAIVVLLIFWKKLP